MTIVLLDGNNLAMRAYHVAKGRMTNHDGVETGSLHIFMRSLSNLLHEIRPDRFVICWDGDGGSKFRFQMYPQYKHARRSEHHQGPPGHATTFALLQEFLALINIGQWRAPGVEADDLIAQVVVDEPEEHIVILSSDKDLLQCLVRENVEQWRFTSDGPEVWTRSRVISELGYPPEKIPLMMALTGDVSDSIPGAKGIGPKRAFALLQAYDWDLGKIIQARPDGPLIRTCLSLVKLPAPDTHVLWAPDYRPLSMRSSMADWQAVADFCTRYELRSIWSELEAGTLLAQGSPV